MGKQVKPGLDRMEFRWTVEMLDAMKAEAKKLGLSPSEYVRAAVLEKMGRGGTVLDGAAMKPPGRPRRKP